MPLEKKPFVNYTLDEDKTEQNSETLTIRINKEERILIDELKALLNFTQDAKVIKIALQTQINVVHSTFGAPNLRYISSSTRKRPIKELQQ